jgi:hypothetical protein
LTVGNFDKDFKLLQTNGGVVVPNNADWKEIENMMVKIKEEQKRAVEDWNFDAEREKINLKHVISAAFARSIQSNQEANIRRHVANMLSCLTPQYYYPKKSQETLLQDTYDLIKTIETKGTAFLGVNADRFYRIVYLKETLDWKSGLPTNYDHAVALVGYSVSKDVFYIKDSNTPYLIEISPSNLMQSMEFAAVLVPMNNLHGIYSCYNRS